MVSCWSIVGTCTDDKAMRSGTGEVAADFWIRFTYALKISELYPSWNFAVSGYTKDPCAFPRGKKKKSNLCSFSCREKAYFCRSCFLVLCLLVLRNLGKLWGFSPMLVLVKYGLWVQKWWREAGMGRHSSGECSVSIGNQSKNMHVAAAQLCYYLKLLAKPVKQPLK